MTKRIFVGSTEILTTNNGYTKHQINIALSQKQDRMISGTNIKTINGESILGRGSFTNVVQARLDVLPDLNTSSDRTKVMVYCDNNGTKSKVSLRDMYGLLLRTGTEVPSDMQTGEYLFLEKGEE